MIWILVSITWNSRIWRKWNCHSIVQIMAVSSIQLVLWELNRIPFYGNVSKKILWFVLNITFYSGLKSIQSTVNPRRELTWCLLRFFIFHSLWLQNDYFTFHEKTSFKIMLLKAWKRMSVNWKNNPMEKLTISVLKMIYIDNFESYYTK